MEQATRVIEIEDNYLTALITRTAENTAEAIIARVAAMIMEPKPTREERRILAENMRRKGYSFGKIATRLNVSRATAYQLTKHIVNNENGQI